MSTFRHLWRVVIDGKPYEVRTTARDMAGLSISPDGTAPTEIMKMLYAALVRTEAEGIPPTFNAFLDVIDDFDDLEADGTADALDPTGQTR